jgi:hypothetical protein
MILRNYILEPELVEQLALVPLAPTHHHATPSLHRDRATESRQAGTFNRLLQHYRHESDLA